MKSKISFNGKQCFIVAEVSANHGHNFKRAVNLIKKAKACGADAVKFQAYTADTLTLDVDNPYFRVRHSQWGGQTLYQLYQKAYTPWKWFKLLKKIADKEGIIFFATAFDPTSVDMLEEIRVPLYKIASCELVDIPLIRYVARTKKPLMLSTGMATLAEIKEAVAAARSSGAKNLALLKCVSSYPARASDMNLATIQHMQKTFRCAVGLSDHGLDVVPSLAAVALGARIIEKHFTLSRSLKTVDHFFSLEPQEFSLLVKAIRTAEESRGVVRYGCTPDEKSSVKFRRSLFVVSDIHKGEKLSAYNIRSIRPAIGLSPKFFPKTIGRKARRFLKKGTPLQWKDISD